MPGISELLIILALTVAIGVATRFFGKPGLGGEKGASSSRKSLVDDKGQKLKRDPESGVYIPESDDTNEE